jgi:DNA-directed RNA polymerase specialized sigma24 family protein
VRRDPGSDLARGTIAVALEHLDGTARLVLALLHVERLTVEETAEALGLECAEVTRTAERARLWLSSRVEERSQGGCEGRAA